MLKIYFRTDCDVSLTTPSKNKIERQKRKTLISQDGSGQLLALTTSLHKASFSMPLAALEYGGECWKEFSLWPAYCLPCYQSFFDAYRILTQGPSQCLL